MDVKNTHSVTKTEISVFGRQALDAERRRSPSLADKVLKLIKNEICESVTLIINQSLTTGIFPNKLKIAKVIPLLKKR